MSTQCRNNFKNKCSYQMHNLQCKTCPSSCFFEENYFWFCHTDNELLIIWIKSTIASVNLKCFLPIIYCFSVCQVFSHILAFWNAFQNSCKSLKYLGVIQKLCLLETSSFWPPPILVRSCDAYDAYFE